MGHAVAGSTGAAISNVCTYPLDLIITRLQIQRSLRKDLSSADPNEYKGIIDGARKIHAEGGVPAFYAGIVHDTGKTIADSFFFFLAYTFLRQRRLRANGPNAKHLPAIDELAVGFLAGSFAKFLTTPIANVVTRKQTTALIAARSFDETSLNPARPESTRDIASQIYSEKGIMGFWSGYSASLILTLNPSITFFLHSLLQRLSLPRSKRDNPPATATFIIAAFSKVIASTLTYPFSLAKSRVQVSSKLMESDNDEEVKEEIEDVTGSSRLTGTEKERTAARATIFATVLRIAETEGLSALYEGLEGEIVKGFFSHGITMIIKDIVHRSIVKSYYIMLILMRKYPTPEELMQQARVQASEYADVAKQNALDTATQVKDSAVDTATQVKDNASSVLEKGRATASDLWNSADETAEFVGEYVEEESEEWRKLYTSHWHFWDDD